MKKLVVFDLDSMLAVSKKPISPAMAKLLVELAGLYEVCVMTGGAYKQVEENVIEQLPITPSQLGHFYFMPLNGAQYHHYDTTSDKWQHEQFVEDLPITDRARIARVLEQLCTMLRLQHDEVLFVGSRSQGGASGNPTEALGIDVISVEGIQKIESVIEGLIADRRQHIKGPAFPWGDTQLPEGLGEIVAPLVNLHVTSREDMKQRVRDLLGEHDMKLLDTHNTTAMIFRFTVDDVEYGLKIEYGAAEVVRNEVRWYELMPTDLKSHHVLSHISGSYTFLLLKWLRHAKTIEDFAVASDSQTMDLVLQALKQDKELFESNPTFPLHTSKGSSFFFDKYHSYNAGARKYSYLQQLLDSETIRINGREFGGPYQYVQRVQQDDELRTYLSPDRAGLIHGDSHAGNLLVEDGRVYMIDPKTTDPFPLEYDTGRMHWSLTGWNAIVRGEFTLQQKDGGYTFDVTVPERYVKGFPRFRAYFSEQDYHRAVFSSAMQYICRVSHAAKQDEATALYLRGLQVFDELFTELNVKI